MGADGKPSDDALPTVVEHVWDAFKPEHVLFGSDWPVCLLAGLSYREVLADPACVTNTHCTRDRCGVWGECRAVLWPIRYAAQLTPSKREYRLD